MKTVNEAQSELFWENEIRINRLTAQALIGNVLLFSIVLILTFLNKGSISNLIVLIVACPTILSLITYFTAWRCKCSKKWLKWLILGCTIMFSGCVCFVNPLLYSFVAYEPVLLSTLYYSKKEFKVIGVLNWFFFTGAASLNILLDATNVTIQKMHTYMHINIWDSSKLGLLLQYYLILTLLYCLMVAICYKIVLWGRAMLNEQARRHIEVTKMETELAAASHLQLSSLPASLYRSTDGMLSIQAFIRPAHLVGGDFYHYFFVGDNVFFMVADVSDKGLVAAMFMMRAKDAVTTAVQSCDSLAAAVEKANTMLCQNNPDNLFVTLWLGGVNVHTGIGKYVNCGHPSPLIKHMDGSVTAIESSPDLMLGALDDVKPDTHVLRLSSTDTLIVFSDGLTDAENKDGEFFGIDRLQQTVADIQPGLENLCDDVIAEIDQYANGEMQSDDMTLLTVNLHTNVLSISWQFRFKAVSNSVDHIIDEVAGLLKEQQCPEHVQREIAIAFDEICDNIVQYSYFEEEGLFEVGIFVGNNYFEATILDQGKPFNPLAVKDPNFSDGPQIGGYGLYIVRNIMDEVEYSHVEGKNCLRLLKIWGI